jgi:hypothetical protein
MGETMCMVMGYVNLGLGYAVMGVEFIDTIRNMIMPEEVSEAPAE